MKNIIGAISAFINRPCSFATQLSHQLIIALFFGIYVFAFTIIFQAFGIREMAHGKVLLCAVYGLSTILFVFLGQLITQKLLDTSNWMLKDYMVLIVIVITVISICNWGYDKKFVDDPTIRDIPLIKVILMCQMIGFVPGVVTFYFMENFLNYRKTYKLLEDKHNKSTEEDFIIHFDSRNKNEDISLHAQKLIYLKSESNYVKICYFNKDNQVTSVLIRNTISSLENHLEKYEFLKRCHRSYIVNLNQVSHVGTYSRNHCFVIKDQDIKIPTSRSLNMGTLKDMLLSAEKVDKVTHSLKFHQ